MKDEHHETKTDHEGGGDNKSRRSPVNKFILFLVFLLTVSLFAGVVSATPVLNFTSPTPENNSYISNNFTQVNITINESNLDTFKFNWNNTNYSFYDDSLVLALNFNNNSAIGENGSHMTDISKYENNGSCSEATCPTWNSSGRLGGAYEFDGLNDYVNCGSDASLNIADNLTVEAWVKLDNGVASSVMGKGVRTQLRQPEINIRRLNLAIFS